MRKLTIDRSVWLRGAADSYLLREDGKRCCVGIYLGACGVSDEQLFKRCTAFSVSVFDDEAEFPQEARWTLDDVYNNSDTAMKLYRTNDDLSLSAEQRETRVRELFAEQDIEVEFVG